MPSKEVVKKTHTSGDKDSGVTTGLAGDGGKSNRSNVVATDPTGKDPEKVPADVIVLAGTGKETEANRTASASSAAGAFLDVEMEDTTIKEKVNRSADEFEKLFYAYGERLMQATQEVLEQAKGVDAQSSRDITNSWGLVRKQMQPTLNRCLVKLTDSVQDSDEFTRPLEMAHPGVRAVAFRDLLENARTDITGSLEELVKWFVAHADDPAAIRSVADHKQGAYEQLYNSVLGKMGRDILDRMADNGSTQVDFGRDSDYGQALQAQHTLARERDELQLQLDGFHRQVEDLKASEADLYVRCRELQDKFSKAQVDLMTSRDKVEILDAVTTFLDTQDADVVGVLAHIKSKYRKLEAQIAEFESHVCPTDSSVFQDDDARFAELESQLRSAQSANVNLQRTIADYERQLASGSGGPRKSLEERAQAIGFVHDASGQLLLGPPPSQGFDTSKPCTYTGRYGQR